MARSRAIPRTPLMDVRTEQEPDARIEYVRLDVVMGWPRNPKLHDVPGITASTQTGCG